MVMTLSELLFHCLVFHFIRFFLSHPSNHVMNPYSGEWMTPIPCRVIYK